MMLRITALSALALFTATGALAQTVTSVSVFATGGAVGATGPDSITNTGTNVWVEYGNGAASTGGMGDSTIVEYSPNGTVENTYSVPGLVDGLKVNPSTGMVWALQNND